MSKKQPQGIKPARRNTGSRKANIFELGKSVERYVVSFTPYASYAESLRFAEACLIFLEKKHPKELRKLKFDSQSTDLSLYIGKLMYVILHDLNYIIKNDEQDAIVRDINNYKLEFLKPFEYDFNYYVLDIKSMWQLNEPLRIGYAHILDRAQAMSTYESDFFSEQYNSKTILNGMDVNDIAGELEKTKEEVLQIFKHYKSEIKKWRAYLKKDIKIFLDFVPQTLGDKHFYECLKEIYDLGFDYFHKFADNCDNWEHGMSSYSDLLIPIIDYEDDYGKNYVDNLENQFNYQGVTYPCLCTSVDNGKIVNWHKDQDMQNFWRLCQLLNNLGSLFKPN